MELQPNLKPFEALDGQDEDRRPADLDLERIGHEELAWLHDRRHRVDDLRPRRAVLADDAEHRLDLVVIDTDDDRGVRLLEKATRRVEPRRPVFGLEKGVHERSGVLVVHNGNHELHAAEDSAPRPARRAR